MNNHQIEKEIKLSKLKDRLYYEGLQVYQNIQTPFPVTNRQIIQEFICGTLDITDTHTVNSWINYLVSKGIFEHNPDSQTSRHGYIKPSNDTRYYIHFEKCAPTHIDDYGKANGKEPQEANKTKPFSLKQSP